MLGNNHHFQKSLDNKFLSTGQLPNGLHAGYATAASSREWPTDCELSSTITIHIFNTSVEIEAFAGYYFAIEMRLKLLMSFAYCYHYPIEIFVACAVEATNVTCFFLKYKKFLFAHHDVFM